MPSLAAARAEIGISQTTLAARAGVSLATIQRIERGRTRPSPRVVTRLCLVLGTPAAAIAEFQSVARRTQLHPPTIRPALRHVLIVDASHLLLNALRDLLEGEGYQVSTRSPVETDLAVIGRLGPDLIILDDIGTNEATNWNLLEGLHADPRTHSTPLILCSCAGCEADELERRLAKPGLWMVSRPFDLKVLLASVHDALCSPEGKTGTE